MWYSLGFSRSLIMKKRAQFWEGRVEGGGGENPIKQGS